jgi:hypothetical protein
MRTAGWVSCASGPPPSWGSAQTANFTTTTKGMTYMSDNALMDAVTREGVLISASVRYPRFTKRLKPEDLGLESDDVNERLISLGHKKLLPRDALAGLALVESRVHALVERSSFAFLGGLARFLPNTKLDDVQQGLEGLKEEFEAARAEVPG